MDGSVVCGHRQSIQQVMHQENDSGCFSLLPFLFAPEVSIRIWKTRKTWKTGFSICHSSFSVAQEKGTKEQQQQSAVDAQLEIY